MLSQCVRGEEQDWKSLKQGQGGQWRRKGGKEEEVMKGIVVLVLVILLGNVTFAMAH